tara:strand:+ start:891 stop:1271 length:381 start_codon:yes stop_codon:yes gene_type:complete
MIKNLLRLIVLGIFNFAVLFLSDNSNVYQFYKDLNQIRVLEEFNENLIYIIISVLVPILTLFLIFFFRPFIEIYLLHFLKFNFYFLINLLSVSTIYIVLRIYGYDRLNLLLYLLISSVVLYKSEKL